MAERVGTMVRGARGTKTYLAPELLLRRKDDLVYPVSTMSDLWSLGLIMYVALTGAHPWLRAELTDTHYTRFVMQEHTAVFPWRFFPSQLDTLFQRLFAYDVEKRCSLEDFASFLLTQWSAAEVFRAAVTQSRAATKPSSCV
jgi:serine/threonine protein kinase